MKLVSLWGAVLALAFASTTAYAGSPRFLVPEQLEDDAEMPAGFRNEQVVKSHSLAAHMGLGSEDVIFGNPRSFRTNSFNDERTELEPLAATSED